MFSDNAIGFLQTYQAEIIARWLEVCEQNLNPEFTQGRFCQPDAISKLYGQLVEALGRRVYHNLNRTIETIINDETTPSPLDLKELLAAFARSAVWEFELREDSLRDAKVIRDDIAAVGGALRQVYADRLCPKLIELVAAQRKAVAERWLRDLPSGRISDHFSILSDDDLAAFVDQTYDIYQAILAGRDEEKVPNPDEPRQMVTRCEAYLVRQIDYFQPKGFRLVDVTAAVAHLYALLEPIVSRARWDSVATYRASILMLQDARETLVRGLSDAYVARFSKEFYAEVGIMLHRIKNKLTSVPSTMQTVLAVSDDEEFGAMFEPMVITVPEAEVWSEYDARVVALLQAAAGEDADEALAALRVYAVEHQELLDLLRTAKLDYASVEMLHEMLNIVLEGGKQTEELTEELQVRMNEMYEREPPKREVIDIGELVTAAANEAAVDARAKDIRFEFDNLANGYTISGVRREIGRPFVQVIDNAIKYTPEKGKVRVNLTPDGDETVLFSVSDSGIGIPPGEEELVFGLCERCSNAKDFARGTGTGLYYDRITVLHHNGEMWVESGGVGRGSTFFIRLPIHHEPLEAATGE